MTFRFCLFYDSIRYTNSIASKQDFHVKLPAPIENLLQRLRIRRSSGRSDREKPRADRGTFEENSLSVSPGLIKLFQEASSPLSQLILQVHRARESSSDLTAADVLVHVKRLITVFEQNGMTVLGTPDEILPFDPVIHESTASGLLSPGTPVSVTFSGIACGSTLIRKAAVDTLEVH